MIVLFIALLVIIGGIHAAGWRVLWLVAAGLLVGIARRKPSKGGHG